MCGSWIRGTNSAPTRSDARTLGSLTSWHPWLPGDGGPGLADRPETGGNVPVSPWVISLGWRSCQDHAEASALCDQQQPSPSPPLRVGGSPPAAAALSPSLAAAGIQREEGRSGGGGPQHSQLPVGRRLPLSPANSTLSTSTNQHSQPVPCSPLSLQGQQLEWSPGSVKGTLPHRVAPQVPNCGLLQ